MKKVISIVLTLCIFAGLFSTLAGCSKSVPSKGATVTGTVVGGKETSIGSVDKTGWEISIPDGVMNEGTQVLMKVLSEDESVSYQSPDFLLYGTPIEVSGDGAHGVWFAEPVPVTIKIPDQYLKDLAAEELFFATWEDGDWRYFLTDNVNLEKGTATFRTSHFSYLGFGKPSEEDQIKTFAETFAADKYDRELKRERFRQAVGTQIEDVLKASGVDSSTARKQLVLDAVSFMESYAYDGFLDEDSPIKDFAPVDTLVRMADAAEKGDAGREEFDNKAKELFSKAIAYGVEKHVNANKTLWGVVDKQSGYVDKTSKAITILGGLGTAAGAFAEGDKEAGFEAVGNMLTSLAGPKAVLITSTLNYAKVQVQNAGDAARAYWTQAEIEEAYHLYSQAGGALEGDLTTIFSLKGNAEALMNQRIIKAHCDKFGIKEEDMGSASRDAAIKNAWDSLRIYFEERKTAEPVIAKIQKDEEAFIATLKKQGLMAAYSYEKYFGIDKRRSNYSISERLKKLYAVRDIVLNYIDEDQRANVTNEQLARWIDLWISKSEEKDRAGFFEALRESGLYEQSFSSDSAYAWVLVDTVNYDGKEYVDQTNEGGSYSANSSSAPGSYSYTWTYLGDDDYYYDPPLLKGEFSTSTCTFSVPPASFNGGETVTLSLKLAFGAQQLSYFTDKASASADFEKWDLQPGETTGNYIPFTNSDGKESFNIDTYKTVQVYSVGDTLTAVAPAGSEEGDKIALRTMFNGVKQGTCYIYEWKPQ